MSAYLQGLPIKCGMFFGIVTRKLLHPPDRHWTNGKLNENRYDYDHQQGIVDEMKTDDHDQICMTFVDSRQMGSEQLKNDRYIVGHLKRLLPIQQGWYCW